MNHESEYTPQEPMRPEFPTPESSDSSPEYISPKKESVASILFDYLEILVYSICAVLFLFTVCFRVCRVDGSSMRNTLSDRQMLVTTSLSGIENGDIIVFHMTSDTYSRYNEPLVKRVIAHGGQTVRIDYNTQTVYVDGQAQDEPYAAYLDRSGASIGVLTQLPAHDFDYATGLFEMEVPEGYLFVLGDNRNNSADSRTVEVGLVDERRVLGKVVLRLSPFTVFD